MLSGMLPKNPLLQLTAPRVAHTKKQIAECIWSRRGPVTVEFAGNAPDFVPLAEAKKRERAPVELPFHWGKLYDHGWFRLAFPEPVEPGDWLRWDDQGEGTLYVDGLPYAGWDTCHKEWPLPAGVTEAWMESLCLQRGIWGGKQDGLDAAGSRLVVAELVRRDDRYWKAFQDLDVLAEVAMDEAKRTGEQKPLRSLGAHYKAPVERASFLLRRLLRGLDDACNAWDAGGVEALLERTGQLFAELRYDGPGMRAVATGHAHIDLVWLWPERCGEYKAVHTFASANRLMELYPDFHFGYSQSASYEAVERRSPEMLETVRQRMEEGRWEAAGATYVESDTQIACGEGLVRAFLVGHEAFRKTVGASSRVLWIPDVFGYCGCLPQIMKECGVDYFFTTKLTWSTISRFPYSSFRWRGIDGTEVITHVTQACGYNSELRVDELREEELAYRQSDVHDEFLIPSGFGDGGGGPTAGHCERQIRYANLAGVPQTRWGRIDGFFEGLEVVRDDLPSYQGELYFEYHRGIFTTHHRLKAAFRGLERALREEEAVNSLRGAGPVTEHPWKRLIFAQFHDYIPGSSVWDVYAEGIPEMESLAAASRQRARVGLGDGGHEKVFNPLPFAVRWHGRDWIYRLGPLGGGGLEELEAERAPLLEAKAGYLANGEMEARFDEQGCLVELQSGGERVALSGPARLWTYPDNPHQYDCWDIDRQTLSLGRPVEETVTFEGSGTADGIAFVEYSHALGAASRVKTRYWLRPGETVLQVEHEVDWQETGTLVKMVVPTAYRGSHARFGAPFGSVRRAQQAGDAKAEAMFEVPASRWAVVTDDNEYRGLFAVTECKYGFSVRDGQMGISLLRAPQMPWVKRNRELARELPPSDFADNGQHVTVRYALGLYKSELAREAMPAALAESLYSEPIRCAGELPPSPLLGLEGGPSLLPVWCQPLADGFVLRLTETLGRNGECHVRLANGYAAERVDLSGNPVAAESGAEDGWDAARSTLRFVGHRVYSLRIRAAGS